MHLWRRNDDDNGHDDDIYDDDDHDIYDDDYDGNNNSGHDSDDDDGYDSDEDDNDYDEGFGHDDNRWCWSKWSWIESCIIITWALDDGFEGNIFVATPTLYHCI